MSWLIWTLLYIALHFVVYALLLRHVRLFIQERVILAYHVASELTWPVLLGVGSAAGAWPSEDLSVWVAVLSLHGIYSLSFLSLWSLASGGYSLGILQFAESHDGFVSPGERRTLEQIGIDKQDSRLKGVQHIGLVTGRAGRYELTRRGQVAAHLLAGVAWVFDVRESG